MKEVLFLLGSLSTGGAERAVSNISLNLEKNINKKIILFKEKTDYPYEGELLILKRPNSKKVFGKLFDFLSRYNQIKKIKVKHKEIPLISFLDYPNLLNILTRKHGPTILSVRNHMSSKHNRGIKSLFWNKIIKWLYPRADEIIAVSKEIKEDLIESYNIPKEKIKVIYNSYPIEKISNMSLKKIDQEYKHIFDGQVIITAGRLNKQKGQSHLIRAFKLVKDKLPEAKLVIMGDGQLKEELIKLVTNLNLDKSVFFLGFQNNPFKYIANSKLFVLPSYHEGFPNALAEAMVCGIPIVSTDCKSGPREILSPAEFHLPSIDYGINFDRYGVLVPVWERETKDNDAKEKFLADILLELMANDEIINHFSKRSLDRVKDFDIQCIIKEWSGLI